MGAETPWVDSFGNRIDIKSDTYTVDVLPYLTLGSGHSVTFNGKVYRNYQVSSGVLNVLPVKCRS